MNRTRVSVMAIAAVAVAIVVFIVVRSMDRSDDAVSAAYSDVSPAASSSATTTQPVLQMREEGVVALPSDAVGTAPPQSAEVQ